jgi:hypothetical protein
MRDREMTHAVDDLVAAYMNNIIRRSVREFPRPRERFNAAKNVFSLLSARGQSGGIGNVRRYTWRTRLP